ncbi:Ig-like domain-containing protein [Mesobacillus foraminis]|uniref:Bacterial Ig domain-containing protein n=1 Tax=Mesobacillus foraminis TaxID=279826 RepID=A0A4R2BB54_9BACI|nr:Ig-like domain-containing protein [Mesobacillus foraminis]TCN24151.1 hypothetical protein EV146_108265 [Mesobacillus foraminis]
MKRIVSVVASAFLMASAFTGSALAKSTEDFKEEIKMPSLEESNKEFKNELNLNQFNLPKELNKKGASRFSYGKAAEDDVLYESEPNDYFDEADSLPFMTGMFGSFYWDEDFDVYKVKVTTNDEYMAVLGVTDEYPMMQLLYGIYDSGLNYVEPEIYEYQDGIYYQIVPVKPGDYYVVALDGYMLGTDEPYMLMAGMLDVTAPAAPKVNAIDDNDTVITGKAEKGSEVTLKNGSTLLGKPKANSSGNFKLTIKKIKAGSKVTATATDAVGNTSKSTTITVKDKTAPGAPKVNKVDDNDKSIAGKAEAGSTVTIKNGKTNLGSPKTDKSGNFKLTVKPIKAGSKLTLTAKDAAGNVSKATTVTVADKTAPSLTVNEITTKTKSVTGKTEAGAKIAVKAGKTSLGSGTANSKGEFKIGIKAQKKDTTITISATDKAKNTKTVTKKVK